MDNTTIGVISTLAFLVLLGIVRLFYAFNVLRKLKKIEHCVEKGYGEPVSTTQQFSNSEQKFLSEIPNNMQSIPNSGMTMQIPQQQPTQMPFKQQFQQQPSYIAPMPQIVPNQQETKKKDPAWQAMMANRAAKMRAVRYAKRQAQQPQIQQNNTEIEALQERLRQLQGK